MRVNEPTILIQASTAMKTDQKLQEQSCRHYVTLASRLSFLYLPCNPPAGFLDSGGTKVVPIASLRFSCSRLDKWNDQGRQTLLLMIRSNPHPKKKKNLCSMRSTSRPSVTTATALEFTIYIRHSSHLSIKARLNCQSIILHCPPARRWRQSWTPQKCIHHSTTRELPHLTTHRVAV